MSVLATRQNPPRQAKSTSQVVFAAADHDSRSRARLEPLARAIRSRNFDTQIDLPGPGSLSPPWRSNEIRQWPFRVNATTQRDIGRKFRTLLDIPEVRLEDVLYLTRLYLVQLGRLREIQRTVDWSRTTGLIVDYDRGTPCGPLAIAAKHASVPVFTLLHGDPNRASYVPFVADFVLCWSQSQATCLTSWNVSSELAIVGCHWQPERANKLRATGQRLLVGDSGTSSLQSLISATNSLCGRYEFDSIRFRGHPMRHGLPLDLPAHWTQSQGSLLEDLAWATDVVAGQSTILLDAVQAGLAAWTTNTHDASLTASLRGVMSDDNSMPYLRIPGASSDWPYASVGEAALERTVEFILTNLRVTPDEN